MAELRGLPIAGHREGSESVRELISLSPGWASKSRRSMRFRGKLEPAGPGNHGAHGIAGTLSFDRASSLVEKGVRFQTIGRVTALPASALQWVRTTEQETAHLDKLIPQRGPSYVAVRELR